MVAPGAGFSCFKMRVCQVHLGRVQFVDAETTSLKGKTSRSPNFFVFRPIEVLKEPRQGFLDALNPLEQSEHIFSKENPSQSHFDAEKLLRRRCCRIISGSSRHPFCMLFSLQGSRDMDEHDQIILVAIWHYNDVLLRF
jgi:hypothetical protein